jgi:hypothetical protein
MDTLETYQPARARLGDFRPGLSMWRTAAMPYSSDDACHLLGQRECERKNKEEMKQKI